MTDLDRFVIYADEETAASSTKELPILVGLYFTGTEVSTSTISCFLKKAFPYKGNLVKPNLVPYNEFKIDNQIKAFEFINDALRT